MTIVLNPETEALVREEANRQGREADAVVELLIRDALVRSNHEFEETVAGIERGLRDGEEGRDRMFSEYAAEVRNRRELRETGGLASS